jgi:hypothetical protein
MNRVLLKAALAALLAVAVAAVAWVHGGGSGPPRRAHALTVHACGLGAPAKYTHVVWIVFENRSYGDVIGSRSAPYINAVAADCGLATSFRAEAHPSLPNYLAMTSGSTQGVTDDAGPSSHPIAGSSIFSQLGSGWRALEESMPSPCAQDDSGRYAVRHNPAAYYTSIRTACTSQDVALGASPGFDARFTFVTPDLCSDMHDCSTATGDTWLSSFLPKVLSSPQYQAGTTAVFITWDEDDGSPANHVATLVVAPTVPHGARSATAFTHYSMLRTTEELLGVPLLGDARTAASMRTPFHL